MAKIVLLNNRSMAMERLISLRRRLANNQTLYQQYQDAVSLLRQSGIVRLVRPDEVNRPIGRVWYLPHHPVYHASNPGKVRIVFDASAKYDGVSLNDYLLKGPDLTSDITALQIRFQCIPVAVTSDVANMFRQVEVAEHDRSVLRFLWADSLKDSTMTYEFTRQVCGLTSAPSSCIYALLHCIHEFLPPEVASRLSRQFYADNYLDSFSTIHDAIYYCDALKRATLKGGFPLVK
uniref:Reverse transcriptase domain-containing protein n=1 Tax=Trichuris muris TaxID=70415 RepID=A0A5S6QSI0_TRIMR